MPIGAIHQTQVQSRRRPGVPGMPVYVGLGLATHLLINSDPQAAEVYTIEIDTATDDEEYGVNLTSPATASVVIDSGTGSSTTTIAADLADAWNADPIARGYGEAVADAAVITITGGYPGIALTIEEDENAAKMTLTNVTDAATADSVPFGRAMVSTAYQAGYDDELGVIAKSTALSARVSTLTVTYAAAEIYTVGITVEGKRYEVNVAADTNDDTTAAAINAAINAIMPANTVIATVATNVVTLTSELAGKFFEVDLGLVSGTTARLVLADTTNTPACDFNKVFRGISFWTSDEQNLNLASAASDDAAYAPNAGVITVAKGDVWVEVPAGTTVTPGDAVYVELDGTGSAAGRFYTSASATRVKVDRSLLTWRHVAHEDSDADVAALHVNLA